MSLILNLYNYPDGEKSKMHPTTGIGKVNGTVTENLENRRKSILSPLVRFVFLPEICWQPIEHYLELFDRNQETTEKKKTNGAVNETSRIFRKHSFSNLDVFPSLSPYIVNVFLCYVFIMLAYQSLPSTKTTTANRF